MRRGTAHWLLGLITGATLCSLITGPSLEKLIEEKERLKIELFETSERFHQLEKQLHSREGGQVQAVNIELSTAAGTLVELALRKTAAEITAVLIGEEIGRLKPSLLVKLLDRRILTVEEKQYEISVSWVVLDEEITYSLTASAAGQSRQPTELP